MGALRGGLEAITLFLATSLGIPVSTPTPSRVIVGVGTIRCIRRALDVASRIVWAWVLTIPSSAFVAGGCEWLLHNWGCDHASRPL